MVEMPGKTVAYGAYNLSIPNGTGRVYQSVTEHLHVDASVEQLYQTVVRQARVCLEEHKGDFPFCRKKRLFPTPTLMGAGCQLCCQLLKWELGTDAPKFAFCKAIAIML